MIPRIACVTAVAALLLVLPARPAVEDEIRAADQRWAAAVKNRDTAALEKMYTSGLIYAHASGVVEDKAKYIGRLKSGKQKYDAVQIETTRIVPYGDSAVSHSVVRTIGVNDNGPFNDHVMMMHVWVKRGGEWHLAAHQTTKIP
jgi:ketosteroid isomerase-like protein